jgi:hypothetical protein
MAVHLIIGGTPSSLTNTSCGSISAAVAARTFRSVIATLVRSSPSARSAPTLTYIEFVIPRHRR